MNGGGGRPEWTVRLARRAVQDVAPDELPHFAVVSQAYLSASRARRQRAVRRAEPLGLGLEGVAVLLTTAVLAVAAKVSDHLAQELVERGVNAAEPGLRTRLRRWRARRRGGASGESDANGPSGASDDGETAAEPLPALTPEQLAQVRELAVRSGLRQRLAEPMAQAVADGIIAELVTAEARGTSTVTPPDEGADRSDRCDRADGGEAAG